MGEKIAVAAAYQVSFNTVFGRQNQHALYGAANQQTAAVFGYERTSAAVSDAASKEIKVSIPVGGRIMELTYGGRTLPEWAKPVLDSLPERLGSGPAWDSYQAIPTRLDLVVELLRALFALMPDESPTPQITALPDGGVQAEWHSSGGDLEIVMAAGEGPSYYFFNRTTHGEEENGLSGHEGHVRELIRGLR